MLRTPSHPQVVLKFYDILNYFALKRFSRELTRNVYEEIYAIKTEGEDKYIEFYVYIFILKDFIVSFFVDFEMSLLVHTIRIEDFVSFLLFVIKCLNGLPKLIFSIE